MGGSVVRGSVNLSEPGGLLHLGVKGGNQWGKGRGEFQGREGTYGVGNCTEFSTSGISNARLFTNNLSNT